MAQNKGNLSVLIPYKEQNDTYRELIWSMVRKRYENLMPELEICLGDDDSPMYNRARAINNAAVKANGDIFIITDADIIFQRSLLELIIYAAANYPWVVPFTRGLKLNKTVTERLISEGIPEELRFLDSDADFILPFAGPFMNVMTRESFDRIHGMDERFEGWGGEDDAMRISLDTLCGQHCRIRGDIYHLWHPPAVINNEYYSKNCHLVKRYNEANNDKDLIMQLIDEKRK